MSESDRMALAEKQRAVVAALTGGSPAPRDFDAAHVERAATMLARKRAKNAALACPALAEALGADFGELFAGYARDSPLGADGPSDDAVGFARYLRRGACGLSPTAARAVFGVLLRAGMPVWCGFVQRRLYLGMRGRGRAGWVFRVI